MRSSKRKLVLGISSLALASPVFAQLGGLGGVLGGGSKSGGGDPKKIEADLRSIIEKTSIALSKLAEAMGLKESAAKMQQTADDIKSGKVGISDSTNVVSDVSASVKAEMEKNQKEGKKLDSKSSSTAVQALEPGIQSFPLWKSVIDGGKSLDKTALLSLPDLAQAIPKVPTAAKNSLEMYQAGISYLTFSGADTSSLKKSAESALKF